MVVCKRCNRPLTNPTSQKRGYGKTCWIKRDTPDAPQDDRIAHLEQEIQQLRFELRSLRSNNP